MYKTTKEGLKIYKKHVEQYALRHEKIKAGAKKLKEEKPAEGMPGIYGVIVGTFGSYAMVGILREQLSNIKSMALVLGLTPKEQKAIFTEFGLEWKE